MDMKKVKTYAGRLFAAVCTWLLFLELWNVLHYMIVDDTHSYTRVMMHEYYNQENINILFSGASLCYRSFDTQVLDERLGVNTFNVGSSSQDLDASYYLIKDAVNRYDLDHIYLELSPVMALYMDIEERDSGKLNGTYIVSDYMKPSISRTAYLLNASRPEYYVNSFLPARRNWEKLFDLAYVGALLKKKSSADYRDYGYDQLVYDTEYYAGKGYVASKVKTSEHAFYGTDGFTALKVEDINEEWFQYLYKIIRCCKENEVELTLVCAPLSEYLLIAYEKYDEYHRMIERIAGEEKVDFWDFNLIRKEYFSGKAELYQDEAHLNMYGAKNFSELVADLILGKVRYEDICYESLDSRFEAAEPGLCGVAHDLEDMKIIANDGEMFEYQIRAIPDEGEEYLIQEFSCNTEFSVKAGEYGTLTIVARRIDDWSDFTKAEICY